MSRFASFFIRSAFASAFSLACACASGCDPVPPHHVVSPASLTGAPSSPVRARFLPIDGQELVAVTGCDVRFLGLIRGRVTVSNVEDGGMSPGDVLVMKGARDIGVLPAERAPIDALYVDYSPPTCAEPLPHDEVVIHATAAPELSWASGAMRAHLDVGPSVSPNIYFGRLEGTGAVPEHQHDGAWEILCAYEGAGTMTVDGAPQHLAAPSCAMIPPSTKHSWTPDPGTTLRAFQMYTPPGPQERFKKLAAEAALPHP